MILGKIGIDVEIKGSVVCWVWNFIAFEIIEWIKENEWFGNIIWTEYIDLENFGSFAFLWKDSFDWI